MIVGSGIDIAEVPRIAEAIERHGQRFLHRVFTEGEIAYCDSKANRIERYAARFAAKEAGMKAIGTGWNHGVRWKDIEARWQANYRVSRQSCGVCRKTWGQECCIVDFTHCRASDRAGDYRKLMIQHLC
jgi:holo-[acyl-carrier-protein] synthase